MVEAREVKPGVYVDRAILAPEHRNQRVNVVNTMETPTVLRSGTWLGNIHPVQMMTDSETPAKPAKLGDEVKQAVLDNLLEHLTEMQHKQVVEC